MTLKNAYDIPFNRPYLTGNEINNIRQAHEYGKLSGDGIFTRKCHKWLESNSNTTKALLTHSCTAALEMAAILLEIQPGDEVIMPSYTFVSTANAFVLRGGVPVFVDIREDTLNLDEELIERAITGRTKGIVVVHYAGVSCNMDKILSIARRYNIKVVEDAAQGVMSKYKGVPLGGIGDIGAYSFHETKNVISGEGGALLVNDPELVSRAEIIREKGTDRSRFFRGEVDKYTWQDVGSSFLPGELIAAFLFAQLEKAEAITKNRMVLWGFYHDLLEPLEIEGLIRRQFVPIECEHNAHMYYVILAPDVDREKVINRLHAQGIMATFHYVPLHASPGGVRYARSCGELEKTNNLSGRIVRLPLWVGMSEDEQFRVVRTLEQSLE